MKLTSFTDYAFRTLIYLATQDRAVSLSEISDAYGISRNHLIKAVNVLEKSGYVVTKRGPGGGIRLARPAQEINLGEVTRSTEPGFELVECFNDETNTCVISGACQLKKVLREANQAFLDAVGRYSLADITGNPRVLLKLIARG